MPRPVSPNLSDQNDEGTCFAHSLTRILVNAIRQSIPNYFYPLDTSDKCNDIYTSDIFNNVSNHIISNKCSETSANNLLLFSYIYNSLTLRYGCNGGNPNEILEWCCKSYLKTEFGMIGDIMAALPSLSEKDLHHLHRMCQTFLRIFYGEQTNDFVFHSLFIKKDIDSSLLKFIFDNGYYIGVIGNGHIITLVGYREQNNNFFLIIKNSYGKVNKIDTELRAAVRDGIATATFNNMIEAGIDRIIYILPNHLPNELHKVRHKKIMNELIESKTRRTKRSKGGKSRRRRRH